MSHDRSRWSLTLILLIVWIGLTAGRAVAAGYDPSDSPVPPEQIGHLDLTIHDTARGRDIPIRVYLSPSTQPCPLVVFSHGLGGSRINNVYLLPPLAAHGYVVVALQHAGSDDAVWKDVPPAQRMAALKQQVSAQNLLLRVGDVHAALDKIAAWNQEEGSPLYGRIDMRHIGLCGHSFGAVTTEAVSGEAFLGAPSGTDERIRAAIMYSPSAPVRGSAEAAFGQVSIPWMVMTGTRDELTAFGIGTDVANRLTVYPALPPGGKYEVVLYDAEHSAFADGPLPGDQVPPNPNHHRVILALSTAFWDAYLKEDPAARAWLDGDGPRKVLQEQDKWERK